MARAAALADGAAGTGLSVPAGLPAWLAGMLAPREGPVRWWSCCCCPPPWAERRIRGARQYSGFCCVLGGEFRVIMCPARVRRLLCAPSRANAGEPVTSGRLRDTLGLMHPGAGVVLVSLCRHRVAHRDGSC